MSVDSFVQSRVSIDTGSDSHSSNAARGHTHSHNHGPKSTEPAIDARWQMVIPAGTEHAFFESIADELPDADRQALHASQPPSASASAVPSRLMSDSEDPTPLSSSVGGSRRTSILRNRLKHGKTASGMVKTLTGAASSPSIALKTSNMSSSTALTNTVAESRSSLSTSSPSANNNLNRRPAVSSPGLSNLPTPSPPPVPSSAPGPAATPLTSTLPADSAASASGSASNPNTNTSRNPTPPGSISVSRQRMLSLGGTAASSSAPNPNPDPTPNTNANLSATAPLRVTTHELSQTSDDVSEYCIAFVGTKGCGKSTLIRKVCKSYSTVETTTFQAGEFAVNSTVVHVTIGAVVRPIRILEVDSEAVSYPGNLWPSELPRADGILLCYDASNEDSYTRIPELVAGYHALGHAVVILACKSDLHKVISPSRADACGKPYEIGLVEVSAVTDAGKKKLRACFNWEIKAIGRHRRSGNLGGPYRNPASPDILHSSRPAWDSTRATAAATATATPPLTQSSSSSSIAPSRHPNNSAPVLPNLDTSSAANTSTVPSTARTSIDSALANPPPVRAAPLVSTSRRRSPSPPISPSHARPTVEASTSDARPLRPREIIASATPSPSPAPGPTEASTSAAVQRNASSSSIQPTSNASVTSPSLVTPAATTATSTSGGGEPVPDGSRNQQRESSSLQWATLDEILDKLLFVSVSGDDPVFIQHFFLTYRRFATPRSVLLGMQKRMRQLGQETRDPLLAKFAQMRICNLLSQWKENYPTDFGAPGTFGALSALLKQIVSNIHLVHYASDLLPFLEEVPKLVDRETSWAKKEDVVGDDSEEESANGTDEEILPALEDDDEAYVGKGKAFERRSTTASNPPPPSSSSTTDHRPYPSKASSSAPNVATIPTTTVTVPPVQQASKPSPSSGIYISDMKEAVISIDRPLPNMGRVNIKELRNVATYIIQTEPVHTAQEITRRMLILFKRIEARDWLRRTLSTQGYDKEHDAIGQLTRLFNYLSCWVSAMIVAFDRPQARARVVDKMILIAKALRQLNNYLGMKALVAGINSVRGNDDEELTQIIAAKPNSNWKHFQSLYVLLGSARMGQAYRIALKHTVGPAIPDLERHGSDLLRTNEANLDHNPQDSSLIHWGKFTIMGKLVGTITLYQNRCHTMPDYRDLEERPHISNLIFNQVVWDYDTLMNREARALDEAHTTESSSGLRRLIPSFKG